MGTGPDRTGVTALLTGILSQQGATLHDIEQVVVQGQLTLCLLVGVPETRDVLKELLFAAKQLGMGEATLTRKVRKWGWPAS